MLSLLTELGFGAPAQRQGTWVDLAYVRCLLYKRDHLGNRIPEFFTCGELTGRAGIPHVAA